MTTAEPTSGAASWIHWLEATFGVEAAALTLDALSEVGRKKDALSARLAFGKLSSNVRPIPVASAEVTPVLRGALEPEYLAQDIASRLTFLVGLADVLGSSDLTDVITTLYRTGSAREQISVLRALPFLAVSFAPSEPGLIALAREASRTNDVAVFTALACDSAFPAAHLPDPAFEQLVLKALFMGVPVTRITGVETRVTTELKRMIGDFADERRAAGRTVPEDVPWLLTLSPRVTKPV